MSLISHRGAKGLAHENTVASIQMAANLDVPYIEFDVQHTKDKRLVLFHNNKTAAGKIINDTIYAEIKEEYPNLAELNESLIACGKSTPLVEIKTLTTATIALPLLKAHKGIAVTSFVPDEILYLKKELPKSQLFIMQHKHPFGILKKADSTGATGVGLNKNWAILLPHYYWQAQKRGLDVYTFTVNSPFVAALFLRIMPELLICTDYPDRLKNIQASRRIVTLIGVLLLGSIVLELMLLTYRRFAL